MYWDRFAARRVSRRRALQAGSAAAAGFAALQFAGCGNPSSPEIESPTESADLSEASVLNPANPPKRGGHLITAAAAAFGTFDPHTGIAVASAYFPRVYNVLVNQSAARPEFLFHDLAESFEIPDETTYIFKIRPGVKVAPNDMGVPERDIDGEDVRVSLERIKAEGAATNYSFARDHIESVEVTADSVIVKSPEPYAWFLSRIGHFFNTIVPRELLVGDLSKLAQRAVGGGAYRLAEITEGEAARFERNPNYYRRDPANKDAPLPYVDGLEVRVIYETATQRAAFESGQIHQYMTGNGADARSLGDAVIARDPHYAYVSFTMNPERPPFNDPRVRRAFSRAINRQQYIDVIYGGDARADGLVQWPLGSYALPDEELAKLQPFDREEARRLVDEVGGIKVKMMYPVTPILEHAQHVPIFVQQMKEAGIDIQQDPQDFVRWIENIKSLAYDCTLNLNQLYETPEVPLNIHTARGPFGDGTYLRGLGDPEIEAAVRATAEAIDLDERIKAVRDAQRLIYSKDPISFPLVTPYVHTAWRKEVKNIPTGVGTSSFLINTFWIDS